MSRPAPSSYRAFGAAHLGHAVPIREGSTAGQVGELDLIENLHYLHTTGLRPPVVHQQFSTNGMVTAASVTPAMKAHWGRRPFVDPTDWQIHVLAAMSGATDTGKVRFEAASNVAGGAGGSSDSALGVTIDVPAGSAQWTLVSGRFTCDPAQAIDWIEMHLFCSGATDTVRVHAVEIHPYLGSVAAGVTTAGFVPHDTLETSADDPLSTYTRQRMLGNLRTLWKTRSGSVVSYSDDLSRATAEIETTSASYQLVQVVPYRSGVGQVSLEWALSGHVTGAGTGNVKLVTSRMLAEGTSEVQALQNVWTSPYTAARHDWDDGGNAVLPVYENQSGHLYVYLQSDGAATARLHSLTAWWKDVA